MATRQTKNTGLSRLIIPVFCIMLVGYFAFHGYEGSLGYKSGKALEEETIQLQFELSRLQEKRDELEHRVNLLRSGRIEKDMLDQHVRDNLNLLLDNEVVALETSVN